MATVTVHFFTHDAPDAGRAVPARTGQSLMQAALAAGIDGIAADCGGLLTCATCHVRVREPHASRLPPPLEEERSMLAFTASPCGPASRLSCQIAITPELDGLAVDLPASQY